LTELLNEILSQINCFSQKKFFRLEMEGGTTVEARIAQMKKFTDQLAVLGAQVGEEDKLLHCLVICRRRIRRW